MSTRFPFTNDSVHEQARPGESRGRVLVVEDNVPIRRVLTDLLAEEGYEYREASDGSEALKVLELWRPDLILLDLMMPVMDGPTFRLVQRSRPELRDIPVIVISGGRGLDAITAPMEAAAVLAKPFDIEQVLTAVRSVLEQT